MANQKPEKQKIEKQLEHLKVLRAGGSTDGALQELRKALKDRVNIIVAKAAKIAAEWEAQALLPDLLEAYSRLFAKASESDPQCAGKTELAKCLKELGWAEAAPFVRGLEHQQWEAVWGGKTDTAAALRSVCALALVQCTDITRHQILVHLVGAVSEADAGVRTDAARALEQMGGREVTLLLRLKARSGDKEVRVTGQILESLLALEGAAGVPFVVEFLQNPNPEIGEEAALALGASRVPEAVTALIEACQKRSALRGQSILLRAISASRHNSAMDFLLSQIKDAPIETAEDSLWALQLHKDSEELVKRIEQAVAERIELHALFGQIYASRS